MSNLSISAVAILQPKVGQLRSTLDIHPLNQCVIVFHCSYIFALRKSIHVCGQVCEKHPLGPFNMFDVALSARLTLLTLRQTACENTFCNMFKWKRLWSILTCQEDCTADAMCSHSVNGIMLSIVQIMQTLCVQIL